MATNEKKQNYTPAIVVMFALFFMIAFVTNLAGSMGVIVTNQFGASKALSQLGTLANFIAYACMGIPAGLILKRKGYKFTALLAVTIGLVGVELKDHIKFSFKWLWLLSVVMLAFAVVTGIV